MASYHQVNFRMTDQFVFLDKWWIVYAVVFGALFVVIFLLMIALCCIECSSGSNRERYLLSKN